MGGRRRQRAYSRALQLVNGPNTAGARLAAPPCRAPCPIPGLAAAAATQSSRLIGRFVKGRLKTKTFAQPLRTHRGNALRLSAMQRLTLVNRRFPREASPRDPADDLWLPSLVVEAA